jgi:hypothetical protein
LRHIWPRADSSQEVEGTLRSLGWVLLRRITRAFESSHSQGLSKPSEASVDKKGVAPDYSTGW